MSPPVLLGFHCSHEQHAPSALLQHARLAAQAGFTAAMCSDHFRPWSERQGHSGFTWSWLGAALEATPMSFGTVCAPGERYHPAVIAQAAATLAEMYPDRFWLAIGSGEALNEAITGAPWPPKAARNERLQECADLMRALWSGGTVSARRHVGVDDAKLYVRAPRPPLLVGAALSRPTAAWMGSWADALVTVAMERDPLRALVDAFRENGGEGKPIFLQLAVSFAPTDAEAVRAAHEQWRHAVLPSDQLAEVRTPAEFDRLCQGVEPDAVGRRLQATSDIGRIAASVQELGELGFQRIYLHNVARDHQERFIEACAARLLPAVR
jgi:probable non-F420 flavinoid oxidoreductase